MPIALSSAETPPSEWVVACLCAAWCRTCDAYRPDLEAVAARVAGVRFHWIDVEDDADWVEALDVETFPTLLVLARGEPLFFGPLPPQIGVFERTLQTLREPGARATPLADDLAQALRDLGQRLLAEER